ncbi:pectinesterase-like [Argentina anserina]|uniref:pectinesterase-like n=1 Tax=Argentina anserina TaxID=57926 RepID=UPI0021762350|nr:pectinesterase-like [Potentilla anserina]
MELVQNVASTMSRIHDDIDDDNGPNLKVSLLYCVNLLDESAAVMNWTLSAINQQSTLGQEQFYATGDAISHARTLLNGSLGSQEMCTKILVGAKYFMVAGRLKQMTTSVYDILDMLQVPQYAPDFSRAPGASLLSWSRFGGMKISKKPNFIVSQDGKGNFKNIMDAIKHAPSHSTNYFVILVKRGVYYEYVNIDETKSNFVLMGEGMDVTIISGSKSAGGGQQTVDSATFAVRALGFIAMDIGFENTAGQANGQALAVLTGGDRSAFYRCKLSGNQDTLLVQAGRQFFRECQISGTVDFIFGYGKAVFQNCTIYIKKNQIGGTSVLAANGCGSPSDPSAFSFHLCTITGDPNVVTKDSTRNGAYLGRAWADYARTVFMQSTIHNVLRPEGWLPWEGRGVDKEYFGEYMNNGPGANVSDRITWPCHHFMSSSEADRFTVANLIDGSSWLSTLGIPHTLGLDGS